MITLRVLKAVSSEIQFKADVLFEGCSESVLDYNQIIIWMFSLWTVVICDWTNEYRNPLRR